MTKLISITEHKSNYPTPITFSFGDTVTLGKLDTEYAGWIRVTTFDGNVGWAPIQYIDFEMGSSVGIATHNYSARELDTIVGEIVILIHELNDWFLVRNEQGLVGWLPAKTLTTV